MSTEMILAVIANSRKPKTCREIMEEAEIPTREFAAASATLRRLVASGRLIDGEPRECSISGKMVKTYGKAKMPPKTAESWRARVQQLVSGGLKKGGRYA
jgi:hypothetical protein